MANMATVAEQLRQAREAQKLTIQDVAEITKVRGDHIRALEDGNFDVFSAPVYIKGFVRSYATLLKLDVPVVMSELEAELGQTQKFSEPPPLSDEPRGILDFVMLQLSKLDLRKSAIGLGIIGSVIAVLLPLWLWRHYRNADPLTGLKPGLYHSTQAVSGETLPLPARKQ
jgi:cytoskeletal protein RodZ